MPALGGRPGRRRPGAVAMSGTETGCATDAALPITGDIITIGARADPSPSAARHNSLICNAFLVRMLRNGA
jgi:hypothetical protein